MSMHDYIHVYIYAFIYSAEQNAIRLSSSGYYSKCPEM